MLIRAKLLSAACGALVIGVIGAIGVAPGQTSTQTSSQTSSRAQAAVSDEIAPPAQVEGVAEALGISERQARARLHQQQEAHETYKRLPASLHGELAGHWFEADSGKLAVAVTSPAAAKAARVAGAEARVVERSQAELDALVRGVRRLAGRHVDGLSSFGVDVRSNDVLITVDRTKATAQTRSFLRKAKQLGGVRVAETNRSPVQQAGEVNPGDPWWPGGESNCSVGGDRRRGRVPLRQHRAQLRVRHRHQGRPGHRLRPHRRGPHHQHGLLAGR